MHRSRPQFDATYISPASLHSALHGRTLQALSLSGRVPALLFQNMCVHSSIHRLKDEGETSGLESSALQPVSEPPVTTLPPVSLQSRLVCGNTSLIAGSPGTPHFGMPAVLGVVHEGSIGLSQGSVKGSLNGVSGLFSDMAGVSSASLSLGLLSLKSTICADAFNSVVDGWISLSDSKERFVASLAKEEQNAFFRVPLSSSVTAGFGVSTSSHKLLGRENQAQAGLQYHSPRLNCALSASSSSVANHEFLGSGTLLAPEGNSSVSACVSSTGQASVGATLAIQRGTFRVKVSNAATGADVHFGFEPSVNSKSYGCSLGLRVSCFYSGAISFAPYIRTSSTT